MWCSWENLPDRVQNWPRSTWLFLILCLLQWLALLSLQIAVHFLNASVLSLHIELALLAALFVTSCFMLAFAFWSVWTENRYQLVACLICSLWLTARLFIMCELELPVQEEPLSQDVICDYTIGIACYQVLIIMLTISVFKTFGWRAYLKVGADPNLMAMYQCYQQFQTSLLADLQFSLGYLFTTSAIYFNNTEYWWWSAGSLMATLAWAAVGIQATRTESSILIRLFFVLSLAKPLYVLESLHIIMGVGVFDEIDVADATDVETEDMLNAEHDLFFWMMASAAATLVWRCVAVLLCLRVAGNFERGLKEAVFEESNMGLCCQPRKRSRSVNGTDKSQSLLG